MTHAAFIELLSSADAPVVLLEGTRELPEGLAPQLTGFAEHLARSFPHARFRTGNAAGSDEAFAAGVAGVDPSRLEFILPYATHRSSRLPAASSSTAIDDLPSNSVQEVLDATLAASPQYLRVAVNYRGGKTHPRQRATAQLILRDTLKVTGTHTLAPPVAGIFFANPANHDRGGTGHTMRVCRTLGVPVITQADWLDWRF
jgi:hypothetical protein